MDRHDLELGGGGYLVSLPTAVGNDPQCPCFLELGSSTRASGTVIGFPIVPATVNRVTANAGWSDTAAPARFAKSRLPLYYAFPWRNGCPECCGVCSAR